LKFAPEPYKGHHNDRREDQTGSGQAGTKRTDPGSLRAIFSLVFPAPALGAIGRLEPFMFSGRYIY